MKTEPVAFGIVITPSFPRESSFFQPSISVTSPMDVRAQQSLNDSRRRTRLNQLRETFFRLGGRPGGPRHSFLPCLLPLVMFLWASAWAGQSVSLSWDPNASSGAAGYALYSGTTSSNFTTRIDVGTNTTVTLTGLTEGQTNYFAVAAYNSARVESPPSSQIVYLVPGMMKFTAAPKSGNPASMTFPAAIGHWYEVQASVNLTSWSTIWQSSASTSNAWLTYQDPQSTTFSKRFYRLLMH